MNTVISDLFDQIEKESGYHLNVSSLPVNITDRENSFEGWYAFYGRGCVRVEVNGDSVLGISVWNRPTSLNKPDFHLDVSTIDVLGEVDTIAKMMHGAGRSLMRSKAFSEDTSNDIDTFMSSIGDMAYAKKLSTLYQSYVPWAEVNDKKALQMAYFMDLAKQWLIQHGKGYYSKVSVEQGKCPEETSVNASQEDDFRKNITQNDAYYKAKIVDRALRNMAQNDPLLNAIFICGAPGEDKLTFTKHIFQAERVWDTQVKVHKGITGFASLLQVLWESRRGKIIVISDSDKLLKYKDKKPFKVAFKLLLRALQTEEQYRVISYSRKQKDEE